jgi:hypothetical protein
MFDSSEFVLLEHVRAAELFIIRQQKRYETAVDDDRQFLKQSCFL